MDYPGFPMGPGGMMPFQGAHPMMMASMQHAAFQQVGLRELCYQFEQ